MTDSRPIPGPGAKDSEQHDPASPSQASLLEFPCVFPIKAMGRTGSGVETVFLDILARHAPDFNASLLESRASSGGKWLSMTARIEATSKAQLDAIYHELSAHELFVCAL